MVVVEVTVVGWSESLTSQLLVAREHSDHGMAHSRASLKCCIECCLCWHLLSGWSLTGYLTWGCFLAVRYSWWKWNLEDLFKDEGDKMSACTGWALEHAQMEARRTAKLLIYGASQLCPAVDMAVAKDSFILSEFWLSNIFVLKSLSICLKMLKISNIFYIIRNKNKFRNTHLKRMNYHMTMY